MLAEEDAQALLSACSGSSREQMAMLAKHSCQSPRRRDIAKAKCLGVLHEERTAEQLERAYSGHRVRVRFEQPLPAADLPELIVTVYAAVVGVERPAEPIAEAAKPAVKPKRSIFPDYIICLEDGKRFKSLRRNLSSDFGMTPDEYRSKWGLPSDYPMVAPNYAATRSELAKKMGLGRKPGAKVKRATKSRAR